MKHTLLTLTLTALMTASSVAIAASCFISDATVLQVITK
jgi:hypothetical protein